MDITFSKNQFEINTSTQPSWNLDEMVDPVRRSLHEEVDSLIIRQRLVDVLLDYEDVRIQTFVPILACRRAQEMLEEKLPKPIWNSS